MEAKILVLLPLGICLWLIKTYFLGKATLQEERFILEKTPKVFLYPATAFLCGMLLVTTIHDFGFLASLEKEIVQRMTIFSLMVFIATVLYTKWDYGIHEATKETRGKNNMQMIALVVLMLFLGSTLS